MRVEKGWTGPKFEVMALDAGADPAHRNVPALEFIEALNSGGTPEKPTKRYKAMVHRIQQHADHGPLTNIEHSRPIGDDLLEFKTPFGDRVLWFYDDKVRRRTVLTNGCERNDFDNAKTVAKALKGDWERWQATHPHD